MTASSTAESDVGGVEEKVSMYSGSSAKLFPNAISAARSVPSQMLYSGDPRRESLLIASCDHSNSYTSKAPVLHVYGKLLRSRSTVGKETTSGRFALSIYGRLTIKSSLASKNCPCPNFGDFNVHNLMRSFAASIARGWNIFRF